MAMIIGFKRFQVFLQDLLINLNVLILNLLFLNQKTLINKNFNILSFPIYCLQVFPNYIFLLIILIKIYLNSIKNNYNSFILPPQSGDQIVLPNLYLSKTSPKKIVVKLLTIVIITY